MLRLVTATTMAFMLLCAVAAARTVDVPARLAAVIPKAHDSDLVVLLPTSSGPRAQSWGTGPPTSSSRSA